MNSLIITIPDKLFAVAESLSFEGVYQPEDFTYCSSTYHCESPACWHITVSNTGGALLLDGVIKAHLVTECARCLAPADLEVQGHVEEYFLLVARDEQEDQDDEEYAVLPESKMIDLQPLLKAALLLALPYTPLCKEDCKGLCSQCGANLNVTTCNCAATQEVDSANPFAVLKTITFDNK